MKKLVFALVGIVGMLALTNNVQAQSIKATNATACPMRIEVKVGCPTLLGGFTATLPAYSMQTWNLGIDVNEVNVWNPNDQSNVQFLLQCVAPGFTLTGSTGITCAVQQGIVVNTSRQNNLYEVQIM